MSQGSFHYFDIHGRGEACRFLLDHAGVKFTDVRIKPEEWPSKKPDHPYNGGGLPRWVASNGDVYYESKAVLRYLAMCYGYYPKDPKVAWECDAMVDFLAPTVDLGNLIIQNKNTEENKKLFKETWMKIFNKLEAILNYARMTTQIKIDTSSGG